ncbi:hypothetical protein [Halomicrococcus sp. SG-WS-1]|uniref:hypothetical protein n=1 Tax=Halomicrococcus sp. SG-WS-1 TaxID=3439057 RepID=UPI003F790963
MKTGSAVSTSKKFASQFLAADSPGEVTEIVEELESNQNLDWKPLGDEPNNYGTVQTQASNPMPCFVELKANADDAVLIRGFKENAPEDADPDDYESMKEVADEFEPENSDINIIADGSIPTEDNVLNLTIRDKGCGQPQDKFEDTFLGLHTPGLIKQQYSFTQGQYGMGGTGVLQFCGDRHVGCYKFVASASHEEKEDWSWSLIRQNRDENQYEYCVLDGEVPTFEGEFGEELSEKAGEDPSFGNQEFGSFVKVYDYRLNISKADIAGQEPFLYKFERYVVNSPLDITLTETRYKSTSVNENRTRGFWPSLKNGGHEELLEGIETISYDFDRVGSEILGERDMRIILFKDEDRLEEVETTSRGKRRFVQAASGNKDAATRSGIQRDHAVMFTVNGQTHGDQGISFLKNRCGYSKIADDAVVIMGFDDFANPDMSDLFKPTRDRLQDGKRETQCLLNGLEEALQSSDMLSEEEERRRAKRSSEDSEFTPESFEQFVNENPEFAEYVNSGTKISGPTLLPGDETEDGEDGSGELGAEEGTEGGDGDRKRTEEPKLPTYLRLIDEYDPDGDHTFWDESKGTMEIEVPVNKPQKVRFGTDAQADYLARSALGGDLMLSNSDLKQSVELRDGVLVLTLAPETDAEEGDGDFLTIQLTRPKATEEDIDEMSIDVDPAEEEEWEEAVYRALTPENAPEDTVADPSPLYEHLQVAYVAEAEPDQGGVSTTTEDTTGDEGAGSGESGESETGKKRKGGLDMPQIQLVNREDWDFDPDAPDFDLTDLDIPEEEIDYDVARKFDETVIARIEPSMDGSVSGLTITINIDAAPLRSFIKNKNIKDSWKPKVENQYRNAVIFLTISQYRELQDQRGDELTEKEIGVTDVLEDCINGMGQIIMPILFTSDEIESMSE